jgi:nucleoside-diphosphate-sugar epimerase
MRITIIGATGTLGRQIARQALDQGYKVNCLTRNLKRAAFLKEWGAELTYCDLSIVETIPLTLKGSSIVIDASTIRSTDSYTLETIDWKAKIAIIEAAKIAQTKHYISFAPKKTLEKETDVILLKLKRKFKQYLSTSGLPYTIFYVDGFFQGLINQFAVQVLEKEPIWITKEQSTLYYIDAIDAAKQIVKNLPQIVKKESENELLLLGSKPWQPLQVIELCEQLCGQKANVRYLPIGVLKLLSTSLNFFQWSRNIADRLSFANVLEDTYKKEGIPEKTQVLDIHKGELTSLEDYLQEYFKKILTKLKDLNYQQGTRNISF